KTAYEIDLMLYAGSKTIAIEVKLAAGVAPQDLARLERVADLVGAAHRYVVCQTHAPSPDARRGVLTLETLIERLLRIARTRWFSESQDDVPHHWHHADCHAPGGGGAVAARAPRRLVAARAGLV